MERTYHNAGKVRVQDTPILVIPSVNLKEMGPEIVQHCFIVVGTVAERSDTAHKSRVRIQILQILQSKIRTTS